MGGRWAFVTVSLALSACGGQGEGDDPLINGPGDPLPPEASAVTYVVQHRVFSRGTDADGTPVEISLLFDELSAGQDSTPATSKNGEWLTMTTTRLGCVEGCLALGKLDGSALEVVNPAAPIAPSGRSAVSDDGDSVVYVDDVDEQLYLIARAGAGWGAPLLLSGDTTEDFHAMPVLARDGSKVLFDCGPTPYSQAGTDVCEVGIDGAGFVKRVDASLPPGRPPDGAFFAHHADYNVDGAIVFETDWTGAEQLWVQDESGPATIFDADYSNDNTPCVLLDGSVASLWLNRPGGPGYHELKIESADSTTSLVLTPDVDIDDVGISCAN